MKKLILILALAVTVLTACVPAHEKYPLMAVVVQSDAETVTAVDYNGNLWEFGYFTEDDYITGDVVILTMDDNGTSIIYDDIVIASKYSGGWTEWNYRLSGEGA